MNELLLHKDAHKALRKCPKHIREKAYKFFSHLRHFGTHNSTIRIKPMRGEYKQYYEAEIDKDYRIIFRKMDDVFFIRYAGTHNDLGTG